MISTNGSVIKLIDSYNGTSLQTFTGEYTAYIPLPCLTLPPAGHLNSKQLPLEASFSPDSQFVISGSSDGRIHIWNSENGQKVCVLNGDHTGPVQCVQVRTNSPWGIMKNIYSNFENKLVKFQKNSFLRTSYCVSEGL